MLKFPLEGTTYFSRNGNCTFNHFPSGSGKQMNRYIYTMDYYLAIKKNEVMALAAIWVDLDIAILSKISQRKINII